MEENNIYIKEKITKVQAKVLAEGPSVILILVLYWLYTSVPMLL